MYWFNYRWCGHEHSADFETLADARDDEAYHKASCKRAGLKPDCQITRTRLYDGV